MGRSSALQGYKDTRKSYGGPAKLPPCGPGQGGRGFLRPPRKMAQKGSPAHRYAQFITGVQGLSRATFSFIIAVRKNSSLSKKPCRVRRRSGENNGIRFLPRHVRGRKHFSGRECANCPRPSDSECMWRTAAYPSKNALKFFAGLRAGSMRAPPQVCAR